MGLPLTPTGGQEHKEGIKRYEFNPATGSWQRRAYRAVDIEFTPISNNPATDVQEAIRNVQTFVDGLQSLLGTHVGTVSTSAALDALLDTSDNTPDLEAGDWAILNVAEGGREAGLYVHDGTSFPATPSLAASAVLNAGAAILSDTLAGAAGVSSDFARADHRHAQSRGNTLPAGDGSGGARHILVGHATLPDSDQWLNAAGHWVES